MSTSRDKRQTEQHTVGPGRHRWIQRFAWLVALMFAVAASVVAVTHGAPSAPPTDYHYTPSAELSEAMALRPDRAQGKQLYERNCASCHAADARGSADGRTPALAGQHYQYLIKQLADLRRGQDRARSEFHQRIAGTLEATQAIADISSYLNELAPTADPRIGPGDQLRLGDELYELLCGSCHGDVGAGYSFLFIPRIGGQHYSYLLAQLDEFAHGHRINAPPEVLDLATSLSPREKAALADYIARLPESGADSASAESN